MSVAGTLATHEKTPWRVRLFVQAPGAAPKGQRPDAPSQNKGNCEIIPLAVAATTSVKGTLRLQT